ncbi:MAG TPA: hypothetical protein VFW32_00225 [Actinomycetes bacterium]|nr:hypothetical protein [Actinomycetes bacterium]
MGLSIRARHAPPTACRRSGKLAGWLLAVLAAAALGGCGGSDQPEPGAAGGATTATAAPTTTAGGPTTSEPAVLGDGRHPVYLKTVDPGQQTITFDLIQFFTGDAAAKAAAEDGQESPPPNDYYIRNVNPRLRTLPVRSGAPITVNVLAAGSTGNATKDVSVTLDELAGYFPNSGTAPFWITVDQGQVTRIAQQFLP